MKTQQQQQPLSSIQSVTNELRWITQKKQSHMAELSKFELKNKELVNAIIANVENLNQSKSNLENELRIRQRQWIRKHQQNEKVKEELQKQVDRYCDLVERYKSDLSNKQKYSMENLQKLVTKQKQSVEQELKICQLESQITQLVKQNETKISELEEKSAKNIQSMIEKYQKFIEQKITLVQRKSQKQIELIKNNNKILIQQLQAKSKNNLYISQEELKKNNTDYQRLIVENGRLLTNLNQSKRKIVNLQAQIESSVQDARIMSKQNQIINTNLKRQIQCLKDNKLDLQERIKKLIETNEDNKWDVKQIQSQKQKQLKKIKDQSSEMIDDIVSTYKLQMSELKSKIKQVSTQKEQLEKKWEQAKRERDSAKQIIQYYKKQKQRHQSQKHIEQVKKNSQQLTEQTQAYKLKSLVSELKKQILRKTAEIEVLKQEVSRLKAKINKVTIAYQQNINAQELMEKQNKMLLSEIVFLRDKNKSKMYSTHKKPEKQNRSRGSSRILDMKSEQSAILDNDNQNGQAELLMYKQLIVQMQKDMNEAVAKLDEKNTIIDKQKAIIQRLQRALNK